MKPPIDFKSTAGRMLRGNNVYGAGGASSPNPTGLNQHKKAAKMVLKKKRKLPNG
jgi:hypothetical protein